MGWALRLMVGMVVLALGLYSVLVPARAQEAARPALDWQVGPTDVPLGDQAILKLPSGYRFLGPEATQQLLKRMGNFPSGQELALITSTKEGEGWFLVARYVDAGYVKDDEAAEWDADALMAAIKEGTEEDNKARHAQGVPPLIIRGWEEKPHYDRAAHKVVWAISAQEQETVGVNYNTLALGRHGYLSMNRGRFFHGWGCSSAGRASGWQSEGQGFDPPHLHHLQVALQPGPEPGFFCLAKIRPCVRTASACSRGRPRRRGGSWRAPPRRSCRWRCARRRSACGTRCGP